MLFNSGVFILVFLPVVFLLFLGTRMVGRQWAISLLVISSLFFYSWTEPAWLPILLGSIIGNYLISRHIFLTRSRGLTALGIVLNLSLLGYYKYTNFFLENVFLLGNAEFALDKIVLPIGISFFTFQQIAYLVDTLNGRVPRYDFLPYCLFVSFFPQLIAGPIVHHQEIMPQLAGEKALRPRLIDIEVGLTILVIGLFKKLVLADSIEIFATPVFAAAGGGYAPTFLEAWGATLAYSFQIYFDFSGYSDMAVGLARLFGVTLPANFDSPYKATNIADFWRTWHMTLSRFLRTYLYIPLGGNRRGSGRRYVNLMTVMVLGGLWHGAGWGFVIWGGLHGAYLVVYHLFETIGGRGVPEGMVRVWLGRLVTFFAVAVAWVFFRAETVDSAFSVLAGMAGLNGFVLDGATAADFGVISDYLLAAGWQLVDSGTTMFIGMAEVKFLVALLVIVWFFPNTQELMAGYSPATNFSAERSRPGWWRRFRWKPSLTWATVTVILFVLAFPHVFQTRPFLYFQF